MSHGAKADINANANRQNGSLIVRYRTSLFDIGRAASWSLTPTSIVPNKSIGEAIAPSIAAKYSLDIVIWFSYGNRRSELQD
jgi:hypothetical protein